MTKQGNYKVGKKEYFRQYRQRPYVKAKNKAYCSTEEYKSRKKISRAKYASTHQEQIKAKNDRWNHSEAGKLSKTRSAIKKRREMKETFNLVDFAKNMYRHRAEITRRRKDEWETGDKIISKDDFIKFCSDNYETLYGLWKQWKESGFVRKLTPSIDRIDGNKGYVEGNMQFLTLYDNQMKYWRTKQ